MTTLTAEKLNEMFSRPDPVEAEIIRRLGAGCVELWDGDTTDLRDMSNLDLLAAAAGRIAGRRADLLQLHQEALANQKAWDALATVLEGLNHDAMPSMNSCNDLWQFGRHRQFSDSDRIEVIGGAGPDGVEVDICTCKGCGVEMPNEHAANCWLATNLSNDRRGQGIFTKAELQKLGWRPLRPKIPDRCLVRTRGPKLYASGWEDAARREQTLHPQDRHISAISESSDKCAERKE